MLVIEKDRPLLTLMRVALELEGFTVETAGTVTEALRSAKHQRPSFVVLGDVLAMSRDELLDQFREICTSRLPFVVVSEEGDRLRWANALGVAAFVRKPFHLTEFIEAAAQARQVANDVPV